MDLIDTHCHLTAEAFDANREAVLARAAVAGVAGMITIGTDRADSRAAAELAASRPNVWFAAGIHPHEAARARPDDLAELQRMWAEPRCVAVGEIGLDYHYDFSPRRTQQEWFARQLEAAGPTGRPVVVHSREAFEDTAAILEHCGYVGRPVVFHCFGGDAAQAQQIAARGWRISFTGTVTFRKAVTLHEIARSYPLEALLIETDCPYLSPEPVRHLRPNEPAHLVHVAAFLARLRGMSLEAIAAATTAAARAFFGLR